MSTLDEEKLSTHMLHNRHARVGDSGTEGDSQVERYGKNRRTRKKCVLVIRPVSDSFRETLDSWTYRLPDKLFRYVDRAA